MTRLAEVEAHIGNMRELFDIVGAMRSLASMRVQEAHRALPGIRRYAATMATAIGDALLLMPEAAPNGGTASGHRAVIVCSAEHGFVGGFNQRLIDAVEQANDAGDALFILGSRGAALAQEHGRKIAWTHPMATRPDGVPETVRRLAAELYRRLARGSITLVDIVFARHPPSGAAAIERQTLLPVDLVALTRRPAAQPPLHNLPPHALLEALTADYVFAQLTEAAVESLAAENEARFAAMTAAHDNVSQKLDELRQQARQARQDEITTELLDLVTGAGALGGAALFRG